MTAPITKSHKLWGGRFSVPTAAALDALNRSIGTDFRLWPHDIRLSQAWAMALWGAGVLTLDESKQIERGLATVGETSCGRRPAPALRRRCAHDDRPDAARRDRRRRIEASHRPQPQRSGCDRNAPLDDGCRAPSSTRRFARFSR